MSISEKTPPTSLAQASRARRLATGFVVLIAAGAGGAAIAWGLHGGFPSGFLFGETGNPLYRAALLLQGKWLYRDMVCQYGPVPVFLYTGLTALLGNRLTTCWLFFLLFSVVNLGLFFRVTARAAGLRIALLMTLACGLPTLLAPGGNLGGSYLNNESCPLERLLLLVLMLAWRVPEQRPASWWLGIGALLGVWQFTKFGGAVFGVAALVAVDLLWFAAHPADWRRWGRGVCLMSGVFALFVIGQVGLYRALLPPDIARDTLWPSYISGDYVAMGGPMPQWYTTAIFLNHQLVPLACGILAVAGLAGLARSSPEPTSGDPAYYGHWIGAAFFLLGLIGYIRHEFLVYQYQWVLVPAAAAVVARMSRPLQVGFFVLTVPAVALLVRNAVAPPELVGTPLVLPTGETVVLDADAEQAMQSVREAQQLVDPGRGEFWVGAFLYTGGGAYLWYNPTYPLRNHLIGGAVFRPYDEEELAVHLDEVPAFVLAVNDSTKTKGMPSVDEEHPLSAALTTEYVERVFARALAQRILANYHLDLKRSHGSYAVLVRNDRR